MIVLGGAGLLFGIISGALAGTDETIQIEGKTDPEISKILKKLRSKAKFLDYQ